MTYRAPVKDMLFVMKHLAGIDAVAQLPGCEDAGYDTAAAVLEECAKFNEGVIAPRAAQPLAFFTASVSAGSTSSTSPTRP